MSGDMEAAIRHGATLVTRNVRDYPIAELNVLTPY